MSKSALRTGLCSALAVLLMLASVGLAAESMGSDQQAISLFQQGVRYYRDGEYGKAAENFEQVLAIKPSSDATMKMFKGVEIAQLVEMSSVPQLATTAKLLVKMRRAVVEQSMRTVPDSDGLLEAYFSDDLWTYMDARAEMLGHGPYAMPYLLKLLSLRGEENQQAITRAMATIDDMRRDICMPLLAALGTDDPVLKTRICTVLGHVGDGRAVPALLTISQNPNMSEPVRQAADEALKTITGRTADGLGSPLQHYESLLHSYLAEDATVVGYVFGDSTEVWHWDTEASELPEKLTYDLVPNYLYYQRQGSELALEALSLQPQSETIQSMLLTAMVRELELVSLAAESGFGTQTTSDALARKAKLAVDLPVACRIYDAEVVGMALDLAIELNDPTAALYLVEQLAEKSGAGKGAAAGALVHALSMPDKDVRYQAAIAIMKISPLGEIGNPDAVVQVMSAALQYAEARTALLVFEAKDEQNRLASVVREQGINALESDMSAGTIQHLLVLEPTIDIIFVDGNTSDSAMASVMQELRSDVRTRAVPTYVITDQGKPAADLSAYEGIEAVLTPDHIRVIELEPILKPTLAPRPSPFAVKRGEVVLLAAQTLLGVDPATTNYSIAALEPSLISSLKGYGPGVQMLSVLNLERFGTEASLPALTELVTAGETTELKAASCNAIARVAERSGMPLPEATMTAVAEALKSDEQALREAAAEALGNGGAPALEVLEHVSAYATPPVMPAPTEVAPEPADKPAHVAPMHVPGPETPVAPTPAPGPEAPEEPAGELQFDESFTF